MNSPNKMFGGMAGILGGATSLGAQDPQTGTMTGVLGGATSLGVQTQQTGTTTGALGGTTNLGVQSQQGVGMQTPPPSSLVNPFKPKDQSTMAKVCGGAQVPGTAFRMEGESPLEGNEFSGALAAAKASGEKSFNVNGKTYPVK